MEFLSLCVSVGAGGRIRAAAACRCAVSRAVCRVNTAVHTVYTAVYIRILIHSICLHRVLSQALTLAATYSHRLPQPNREVAYCISVRPLEPQLPCSTLLVLESHIQNLHVAGNAGTRHRTTHAKETCVVLPRQQERHEHGIHGPYSHRNVVGRARC